MMAQDDRIRAGLEYEQGAVAKRTDGLRRESEQESLAWTARFAQAGHGPGSGTINVQLLRLEVDRLRALMRAACGVRRDLCKTVPELGSHEMLTSRQQQLHERINGEWNAIPYTVAARVGGNQYEPDIRAALNSPRFDTDLILIKADVDRELRMIENEMTLGIHAPTESRHNVTVNISGMVGAVNLGTVAGDMNTNLGYLQSEGPTGAEVARAIARLTEAVANAGALSEEARAEAVESLAVIAQEAALPPDRRKRLIVRALLERMGLVLATTAQVAEIWNAAHPVIAPWFGH